MSRLFALAALTIAVFAGSAMAEHREAHHHAHPGEHAPHAGSCCNQISGHTAQVLIAPSSEAVRRIQAELAVKGFDPGPIDGILGPRTERALRAFQRQEGLYEGLMTTETLTRLGIGVTRHHHERHYSHPSGLSGAAHGEHRTVTVRRVQPSTTTTRIVRSSATTSAPSRDQLPNYIGSGGQHMVEPLTWRNKAER